MTVHDFIRRAYRNRRGTTLLELMAVVLILLMITAVTIPKIAPAVSGRRVREATRMFTVFLAAAKNRAVETGRAAGVWIERSPSTPEVADTLYFVETPEIYAGDFLDSTAALCVVNGSGQVLSRYSGSDYAKYNTVYPNATDQDLWNLVIPRSRTTFMTDMWSNPDPKVQQYIREGDQIQFEGHDRMYTLRILDGVSVVGGGGQQKWWYILNGRNCDTRKGPSGVYLTADKNPVQRSRYTFGQYIINWFDGVHNVNWTALLDLNGRPGDFGAKGLRYKIYRQPVKLQAGSMRLPDNTIIDLNFSSFTDGNATMSFSSSNNNVNDHNAGGIPFHPRLDPGDKHTLKNPYWGDSIFPNDDTPIIMLFTPEGNMNRLYCHYRDGNGNWTWQGNDPYGDVYFLIGKRDHVIPNEQYYDQTKTAQENLDIQLKKTWLDLDSLWIKVSPHTGAISSSLVDDPKNADRYEDVDPGSLKTQFLGGDPSNVYYTRYKAARTRVVGGR